MRSRRVELAILFAITAAAAAARFVHLGDLPLGAAGSEEGTSWLVTAGQLEHGWPLLPSGLAYWKGWPYTALAALVSGLFGLSPWSLRVPAALAGIVSVPLAWWGARGILRCLGVSGWAGAASALFAAYIMAFSEWSLLMSRWGRFYSLGQMLFLAGVAIAAVGFSKQRPTTAFTAGFGIVVVLASATFHSGALLLLALAAALTMGTRFSRRQVLVLAACVGATMLWFVGVLFLWKSGHVETTSGWRDLLQMIHIPFWKHALPLMAVGALGWGLILRSGRLARAIGIAALTLLALVEVAIFTAAGLRGVDTGSLRGFAVLAAGHPGLMALVFGATAGLLAAAPRLAPEGRRAAGMLWIMTVLPIAFVGASTGHFVPRYLLFTVGPLAVAASVGLGLAITYLRRGAPPFGAFLARRDRGGDQQRSSAEARAALGPGPLPSPGAVESPDRLGIPAAPGMRPSHAAAPDRSRLEAIEARTIPSLSAHGPNAWPVRGIASASATRARPVGAEAASVARAVVAAVLLPAAILAVAPAVSPAAPFKMVRQRVGDPWPPLFACSPTRAYALDLEGPSRFVAARMRSEDLIVSTARSIPEAIIGRMDYFFRVPSPGSTAWDESGGPFNILTGCPMLTRPEQVLALCASRRVFVILDERAMRLKDVRALEEELRRRLGPPAYATDPYAEVYVLPPGCGGEPSARSGAPASRPDPRATNASLQGGG